MDEKEILIVGIGNPFRSDDGVGHYVIDQLQSYRGSSIDFLKITSNSLHLIDIWKSRELVIVIDAISANHIPGTIIEMNSIDESLLVVHSESSTHNLGLKETFLMAKALNVLPNQLKVIGIQGKNFDVGVALSSEVHLAADQLVNQLGKDIKRSYQDA